MARRRYSAIQMVTADRGIPPTDAPRRWRPSKRMVYVGIPLAGMVATGLLWWWYTGRRARAALALPGADVPLLGSETDLTTAAPATGLTFPAFTAVLPSYGQIYAPILWQVSGEVGVDPLILAGVLQRETDYGTAKTLSQPGPAGTGDGGHGRGLMQIDDRTWGSWLAANDWTDAYVNIKKGAQILLDGAKYLSRRGIADPNLLIRGALAAYNAGPGRVYQVIASGGDPDVVTTNQNYGAWILSHATAYASSAGVSVPAALAA